MGAHRLTADQFKQRATVKHNGKYTYGQTNYIDSHTKVLITCPVHGEFLQRPNDHLSGYGCVNCKRDTISVIRRIPINQFIDQANTIHKHKFQYNNTQYKAGSSKVIITCPKHGDFSQTTSAHLDGSGCRQCAYEARSCSTEEFIAKATTTHGDKYTYNKVRYVNTATKVTITCTQHGDFNQSPNAHLTQKSGCPKCNKSKGETQIYTWFKNNGYTNIIMEKTFDDCLSPIGWELRYDFYVPECNILIEFDGTHHFSADGIGRNITKEVQQKMYEQTTMHDEIKTKYAIAHNYTLIRIRYDQSVNDILSQRFTS